VRWLFGQGIPEATPDGLLLTGFVGDITERKHTEAQIEQLAFYDPLTGLPNRRLLIERLQLVLAAAHRNHQLGAVMFVDLDNFKDLNDSQGHELGDELLKQVAQRLQNTVREVDTVARLGGDEFVVVLQDLGPELGVVTCRAEQIGRKTLALLNQTYVLGGVEHHSTPSMGITLITPHRQSVEELLKQADLAMYEAKAAGRNTLRFFDPAMQAQVAQRARLDHDLRRALKRQEFVVYYQPVVDSSATVVGVEALVRWQHSLHGLVPPAEFIPVAEQSGSIVEIGLWVLEQGCKQLAAWGQDSMTAELTMAVNVSARQFRHPDFVAQVRQVLQATGAQARLLKLEITESLLLSDSGDAVNTLQALKDLGLSFSLDDFGTGYSSLSYLKKLPLSQLKIDQSFVRDVLTDPNDAAIAKTVLSLGRSLNLTVVAEGVETLGQWQFLFNSGCSLFQGYLFGRPVPIDQLKLGVLLPGASG
jgi:diguanylate cyclase (GGDEF)-like protein